MSSSDARYTVELTRQAEKDLRDLRPWTAQATRAILQLESDPHRGHTLTGSLKGARALEFTLQESGVHRAVYVLLTTERICLVFIVGPHELSMLRQNGATQRYGKLANSERT